MQTLLRRIGIDTLHGSRVDTILSDECKRITDWPHYPASTARGSSPAQTGTLRRWLDRRLCQGV